MQGNGDITLQFLDDGSAITGGGYRHAGTGLDSGGTDRNVVGNDTTSIKIYEGLKSGDDRPMVGSLYFMNARGGRWDSDSNDSEGNVRPSVLYHMGGKDSGNKHRHCTGSGHYDDAAANTCNGFILTFGGGSGATKVNLTVYGVVRS